MYDIKIYNPIIIRAVTGEVYGLVKIKNISRWELPYITIWASLETVNPTFSSQYHIVPLINIQTKPKTVSLGADEEYIFDFYFKNNNIIPGFKYKLTIYVSVQGVVGVKTYTKTKYITVGVPACRETDFREDRKITIDITDIAKPYIFYLGYESDRVSKVEVTVYLNTGVYSSEEALFILKEINGSYQLEPVVLWDVYADEFLKKLDSGIIIVERKCPKDNLRYNLKYKALLNVKLNNPEPSLPKDDIETSILDEPELAPNNDPYIQLDTSDSQEYEPEQKTQDEQNSSSSQIDSKLNWKLVTYAALGLSALFVILSLRRR